MNEIIRSEESPQSLISLALEKGASIEQLEKLLALKERWDATQANKSFISAMSNFQKEVPAIEKRKQVNYPSKTGGNVNYKYAELGEIDESIKGAMASNGLSKRWEVSEDGEKIICTCIISHVDGHTERTSMSSSKDMSGGKNEIQSRASAISYLQRYTLIGALGITTASEDNDGDGAVKEGAVKSTPVGHNATQEDTREWLTELKFKDGIQRILNGEQGVYEALNSEFRMKKFYREDLKKAKPVLNAQAKTPEEIVDQVKINGNGHLHISTPDNKPFQDTGKWYAKLEKCKKQVEVMDLYKANKQTVDAHPEIQKIFKERQDIISHAKKQTA